ncbi:hypothetical protein TNCV_1210361 [Trichonephila clavipes]|nr:hypothetical protein TNCV_1210361 [Trichonephila clavipes]
MLSQDMISTQEPKPVESRVSECGEKFIYTADIGLITFSLYIGSECVKRHRALTVKVHVSSTHPWNHLPKLPFGVP